MNQASTYEIPGGATLDIADLLTRAYQNSLLGPEYVSAQRGPVRVSTD